MKIGYEYLGTMGQLDFRNEHSHWKEEIEDNIQFVINEVFCHSCKVFITKRNYPKIFEVFIENKEYPKINQGLKWRDIRNWK